MSHRTSCNYGKNRRKYNFRVAILCLVCLVLLGMLFKNFLNNDPSKTSSEPTKATTETVKTTKTVIIAQDVDFRKLRAGASLEMEELAIEALKNAKRVDVEVEVTETEVTSSEHLSAPEEPVEEIEEATKTYVLYYTENDVIVLAKLLTKEAGGVPSTTQKSGVIWTVLNRVASGKYPNTITEVVTQPWQFEGWDPNTVPFDDCVELARDVLERWNREMNGETNVGRTLPAEYLFFTGDGVNNYFTTTQYGEPYVWGSQLVSPYKN